MLACFKLVQARRFASMRSSNTLSRSVMVPTALSAVPTITFPTKKSPSKKCQKPSRI